MILDSSRIKIILNDLSKKRLELEKRINELKFQYNLLDYLNNISGSLKSALKLSTYYVNIINDDLLYFNYILNEILLDNEIEEIKSNMKDLYYLDMNNLSSISQYSQYKNKIDILIKKIIEFYENKKIIYNNSLEISKLEIDRDNIKTFISYYQSTILIKKINDSNYFIELLNQLPITQEERIFILNYNLIGNLKIYNNVNLDELYNKTHNFSQTNDIPEKRIIKNNNRQIKYCLYPPRNIYYLYPDNNDFMNDLTLIDNKLYNEVDLLMDYIKYKDVIDTTNYTNNYIYSIKSDNLIIYYSIIDPNNIIVLGIAMFNNRNKVEDRIISQIDSIRQFIENKK